MLFASVQTGSRDYQNVRMGGKGAGSHVALWMCHRKGTIYNIELRSVFQAARLENIIHLAPQVLVAHFDVYHARINRSMPGKLLNRGCTLACFC